MSVDYSGGNRLYAETKKLFDEIKMIQLELEGAKKLEVLDEFRAQVGEQRAVFQASIFDEKTEFRKHMAKLRREFDAMILEKQRQFDRKIIEKRRDTRGEILTIADVRQRNSQIKKLEREVIKNLKKIYNREFYCFRDFEAKYRDLKIHPKNELDNRHHQFEEIDLVHGRLW